MHERIRPVWAEVNLDDLAFNMRNIRAAAKSKEVMAVIKADGYGHGALDIAPVLLENGADRFAVAVISEAIELRKGGIDCPILILGHTVSDFYDDIIKYDIEQTVFSFQSALELSKLAEEKGKRVKVHIAVDTGMGRIGFRPDEEGLLDVIKIGRLPGLILEGMFSHFSTADEKNKEYTKKQLSKFNDFYKKLVQNNVKINVRHLANSAAIMEMPECHFDVVRPGIILYGYYPSDEVDKKLLDIKPVMTLKTKIVHIKKLPVGEYISYGRKFMTERESIIATLPVGYADGYTRLLSGKAKVIVNGHFVNVLGSICMDQCMIDVTDVPNVKNGDEVILMGSEAGLKFDADEMASLIGTINYEIICMIGRRVPRVYVKGGKTAKVRNYI